MLWYKEQTSDNEMKQAIWLFFYLQVTLNNNGDCVNINIFSSKWV